MHLIAHRGASAHRPENTIEAFQHAVELGADWVELDVRVTSDRALAVHHDAHLPDGRLVASTLAADLPASVPLLDAALDACRPLPVNVEIKSDRTEPFFDEARSLAGPTVAALQAWGGEALVSSFDSRMVDAVRALDGAIVTGQLTFLGNRPVEETLTWILRRGHRWWHPYDPLLDGDAVALARSAGVGVNVWTIDDVDRMAEVAEWGVDGIVTNDIPAALGVLRRAP